MASQPILPSKALFREIIWLNTPWSSGLILGQTLPMTMHVYCLMLLICQYDLRRPSLSLCVFSSMIQVRRWLMERSGEWHTKMTLKKQHPASEKTQRPRSFKWNHGKTPWCDGYQLSMLSAINTQTTSIPSALPHLDLGDTICYTQN